MVTRAEFAYREATRAITQQQAVLDNLRTRAGVLFSAASVATAFLAGSAIPKTGGVPALVWAGLGLFVVVALMCLLCLVPIQNLSFSFEATVMLGEGWAGYDEEELYEHLAKFLDRQYQSNSNKISPRMRLLTAAVAFLALASPGVV